MRRGVLFISLVIVMGCLIPKTEGGGGFITQERIKQGKYKDDVLAVKALDPAFSLFPDSSLVDFSFLLSPPAGKFGFVKIGADGHFYFSDTGEGAKFWGIVVSQEHIDIPKDRIAEIVETMARAGINMLRLHAIDNRAGEEYGMVRRSIIDEAYPHNNDSQHFNKDYWDRVDYWISECKRRGIYVYLVLRGYRTFREGDGVPEAGKLGRAARPYAMFNRRLIELQKDYARQFLVEHVNPYTGLSYANDPAVAIIEIFNEDSLFMRPDKWQNMVEPYLTEFRQLWNEWLRKKYGDTAGLHKAWTNYRGECALGAEESVEKGNVGLPNMELESYDKALSADYKDPLRSPMRRHDAVSFAIDLQMQYLKGMKDYLREIGVKVPVTGVVDSQVVADTFTVREALDFTAGNAYYGHPLFLPGKEWVGKSFYEEVNYTKRRDVWSLMPFISRYHWADTPIAVREWSTCWPNKYRSSSILEMAAYGRLQELDLLTYFQYNTTGDVARIGSFNITCDPARWLLFGMGAKMFLRDDVSVARHTVEIGYTDADLKSWATFMQGHQELGWLSKTVNRHLKLGAIKNPKRSLLITSGRTHSADLQGVEQSLIYSNCPNVDFTQRALATGKDNIAYRSGYELSVYDGGEIRVKFHGLGLKEAVEKILLAKRLFSIEEVKAKGYEPFGVAEDRCLGFYDAGRKNLVFAYLPEEEVAPLAAQLQKFWYDAPSDYFSYADKEESWLISDTEEIKRSTKLGLVIIDTPQTQVIQGELEPNREYRSSLMKVKTVNDFAVFVAMALDDKPLTESEYFVVKMVSRAWNRGEKLEKAPYPGREDLFMLFESGSAPIQTGERSEEVPTVVELKGRKLVQSYMVNGWWEAVFDGRKEEIYLASSGRNIRFILSPPWIEPDKEPEFEQTRYYYESPPDKPTTVKGEVIYPAFQKYIRLRTK